MKDHKRKEQGATSMKGRAAASRGKGGQLRWDAAARPNKLTAGDRKGVNATVRWPNPA